MSGNASMLGKYKDMNKKRITKSFFYSWEMILVYIFLIINILLMSIVPQTYFTHGTIPTIIRSGMDLSFMVLGMVFILILGEIDISVSSIMIFSTMVMASLYSVGCPGFIAVIMGIIAGGVLGAFNGFLVTFFKLPSVIVTIATSLLYRGLVQIILGSNYLEIASGSGLQNFLSTLAWYDIGGFLPLSLVIFILFAILFGVILHKTKFGRELYIIGNSKEVANYSGIKVNRVRITAFIIMGMMSALSGLIFIGRLNGITYSMGKGYELKVIAITVLGGVSTLGGKGKIYGPIISVFVMAFIAKMLDLFSVHPNVQKIITGVILIFAVCVPLFNKENFNQLKKKFMEWRKVGDTKPVAEALTPIKVDDKPIGEVKVEQTNKVEEKDIAPIETKNEEKNDMPIENKTEEKPIKEVTKKVKNNTVTPKKPVDKKPTPKKEVVKKNDSKKVPSKKEVSKKQVAPKKVVDKKPTPKKTVKGKGEKK